MTVSARSARWTQRMHAQFDTWDVTEKVTRFVEESGVREGILSVAVTGSTAAITTIEYEDGALQDLRHALDRLAPASESYAHNARWGDGNGFSHVRSALLKTGISIPIVEGEPVLGTWQQIVVLNLDNRAREREVVAVVCGA